MKKNLCVLMITVLMVSLTACGNSKSGSSEALNDDPVVQEPLADGDIEEYAGEGAVTGGIPTDEELAEREAEADSYSSSEETDYSDANVEMTEKPSSSDTFISSDNFWQGEDYFDLEEYYWMNGAKNVGYDNDDRSYAPFAVFNGWVVMRAANNCQVTNISDRTHYLVYNDPTDDARSVAVNEDGATITWDFPKLLDKVLPCLINNNGSDPFADSGLYYVLMFE